MFGRSLIESLLKSLEQSISAEAAANRDVHYGLICCSLSRIINKATIRTKKKNQRFLFYDEKGPEDT